VQRPDCEGVGRLRWTAPEQTETHPTRPAREAHLSTRRRVAVAATLSLAGLTSCGLAEHTSLPTLEPTTAGTPAETTRERTIRLDKEAAEKAYTAARAEGDRLAMAGGASKPTKLLSKNASGFYLEVQMDGLRVLRANGYRAVGQFHTFVTANRGWSAKQIALTACEDASQVRLLDKPGKEVLKDRNRRFVQTLTATKADGRWKITDLNSRVVKRFSNKSGCRTR